MNSKDNHNIEDNNELVGDDQIIDSVEQETTFLENSIQYMKKNPKITAIILLFLLLFTLILPIGRQSDTLLETLQWETHDEKINELKQTLIDGVSIQDTYANTAVLSWHYATDGKNEYLKVETEDDIDIYNTTDQELEENHVNDLLALKKTFIGQSGTYTSNSAEITVLIDEAYDVTLSISLLDSQDSNEDVSDQDATDEDATGEDATDEDATDEVTTDEVTTDEDITDEDITDEVTTDEDIIDELLYDLDNLVFTGEIISATELEVYLNYGEALTFTWSEAVTFNTGTTEFSNETLTQVPALCVALSNQTYTLSEDIVEEDIDEAIVNEDIDRALISDYILTITDIQALKVKFELKGFLDEEYQDIILNGSANKIYETDDTYIYQDIFGYITFSNSEEGLLYVDAFDNNMTSILSAVYTADGTLINAPASDSFDEEIATDELIEITNN